MRVYLVQHGLAVDAKEDPERPLAAQGREDVTRTAGFLSLFEKPAPAWIAHSGKLRAGQTADMFAEAWGDIPVRKAGDLGPNDDPQAWFERLARIGDDVMLVGHLPHLQRLAGLLICRDAEMQPIRFRNGGVACLARGDVSWSLLWHIIPTLFYGE